MSRRTYPPLQPDQGVWLQARLDEKFKSIKEVAFAAGATERAGNSVLAGKAQFSPKWSDAFARTLGLDPASLLARLSECGPAPTVSVRIIARRILVEMRTRTLLVPVDFDHDDLRQVYDSWHEFFHRTRALLHELAGAESPEAGALEAEVDEILNVVMRSHLRRWQIRLHDWLAQQKPTAAWSRLDPQARQKRFPQFPELRKDLEKTQRELSRRAEQLRRSWG
jgi:hypothetical protein